MYKLACNGCCLRFPFEEAIERLHCRCDVQENFREAGTIPPLCRLMLIGHRSNTHLDTSLRACEAVTGLACNNRANQEAVAACGGMRAIIRRVCRIVY